MVRFGAEMVFSSKDSTITDEDIDRIIAKGEAATAELDAKMKKFTEDAIKFKMDESGELPDMNCLVSFCLIIFCFLSNIQGVLSNAYVVLAAAELYDFDDEKVNTIIQESCIHLKILIPMFFLCLLFKSC